MKKLLDMPFAVKIFVLFLLSINLLFAPLSSAPFEPDWSYVTDFLYANFGLSVSSAGDVNGDGYDDIIAGAPYLMNGQAFEGAAFVFYGSENGLSSSPDWSAESDQVEAQFGWSVSSAGDVNGDGYDDVIIGSPRFDAEQNDEGAVFVYYGSKKGLSLEPDWTFWSEMENAFFGFTVSSAGDINGDGYDDIIVGAPYYSEDFEDEGAILVFLGSTSGPGHEPFWIYRSGQDWANLGHCVSSAGDVNGDGFDDIIAGAPYLNFEENEYGSAIVFYGSATSLSNTPDWSAMPIQIGTEYGTSVSSAGDVNGDGYDDVVIGAPMFSVKKPWEGAGFLFMGSSSGLSDLIDWSYSSGVENSVFGYSISSAGDIDGDGFDDLIAGAYGHKNSENFEGGAYIFCGSSSGLQKMYLHLFESGFEDALFGVSVSSAGDVNGDGFSDVIVGASGFPSDGRENGAIHVWYGSASGF
ncbi:FG-GAP repeat protein [candidate division WOR-3 bacterium]|nr:FG-GAP repeat protein [candidate division WOR-3 bacterium]